MRKHGTSQDRQNPEGAKPEFAPKYPNKLAKDGTDWERVLAMSGEEAHRNALADEDSQPMMPEQLARMRRAPNPRAIRLRLGMSQEAFAKQFQIPLGTLRDWEQGVHLPDTTAKTFLRVIEQDPAAVVQALRASVPGHRDWSGRDDRNTP